MRKAAILLALAMTLTPTLAKAQSEAEIRLLIEIRGVADRLSGALKNQGELNDVTTQAKLSITKTLKNLDKRIRALEKRVQKQTGASDK